MMDRRLADVIRRHLGIALRRARLAQGWTLREAAEASRGRFAATSIAGYERGERSISLEGYVDLCRLYGVMPQRLLASTERARSDRAPTIVEVDQLDRMHGRSTSIVALFVDQVRVRRGRSADERIALREEDVQVLASVAGVSSDDLIGGLAASKSLVRPSRSQTPLR